MEGGSTHGLRRGGHDKEDCSCGGTPVVWVSRCWCAGVWSLERSTGSLPDACASGQEVIWRPFCESTTHCRTIDTNGHGATADAAAHLPQQCGAWRARQGLHGRTSEDCNKGEAHGGGGEPTITVQGHLCRGREGRGDAPGIMQAGAAHMPPKRLQRPLTVVHYSYRTPLLWEQTCIIPKGAVSLAVIHTYRHNRQQATSLLGPFTPTRLKEAAACQRAPACIHVLEGA